MLRRAEGVKLSRRVERKRIREIHPGQHWGPCEFRGHELALNNVVAVFVTCLTFVERPLVILIKHDADSWLR